MDFGIAQEISIGINNHKQGLIQGLINELELFFSNKDYGEGIKHYTICLICVKPEFELFHKVRKQRYRKTETIKTLDEKTITLTNTFGYDIKMDYATYINASDKEGLQLFASKIMESLFYLEKLPKHVKDFDKERFKSDLEGFFKEKGLV